MPFPFLEPSTSSTFFPLSGRNIAKPARNVHIYMCMCVCMCMYIKIPYIFLTKMYVSSKTGLQAHPCRLIRFRFSIGGEESSPPPFLSRISHQGWVEGGWVVRSQEKKGEDSWSFAKVNRYWKFNYRGRPLAAFVIFNERVLRRDGKRETNPSGWLLTDGI